MANRTGIFWDREGGRIPLLYVDMLDNTFAIRTVVVNPDGSLVGAGGGAPTADVNVAKWGNVATTLGQKAMVASLPVAIASDQSALPVTGTFFQATQPVSVASLPLPLGAATEATLSAMSAKLPAALVGGRLDVNIGATIALPITDNGGSLTVDAPVGTPMFVRLSDGAAALIGQKLMASSLPVVIASDQSNLPVNITQVAGVAISLAQKVMASSFPVVIASDQSALPLAAGANAIGRETGTLSAANSSAVTLGIGAVFTGVFEDVKDYAMITVSAFADQASAVDGLAFDWSHDGVNQDLTTGSSVLISAGRGFAITPRARFFRVRYTNGGVAQGIFRLGTVYHPTGGGLISRPLDQAMDPENYAQQVRAVLDGFDGTNFVHVAALTAAPAAAETGLVTRSIVYGDVDHDAVNTLKQVQIAGNAQAIDNPPAAVSASGDRVRSWMDRFGASIVRPRQIRETYTAAFRLAEAAARLDQTFTQVANTNKQWATLHHAATATKELKLLKCWAYITSDTVAGIQGIIELRELSAATPPAVGAGVAITGRPHRVSSGAHEATALYLPGTQGTEAAVNSPLGHVPFDTGISGAVSTLNPVPILVPVVLYDAAAEDPSAIPPTAPVGVYGGWAVMIRTVGVPVLRVTIFMRFTEEIP